MNTSSSAPNLNNNNAKVRYGLIKLYIGSSHTVRCPDGKVRQFAVRDKTKFPKVEGVQCVCLKCNQAYSDEETLLAEHPETRVMQKQEEKHVYAWWSTASVDGVASTDKDKKNLNYANIIGLMSDEEMPNQQ